MANPLYKLLQWYDILLQHKPLVCADMNYLVPRVHKNITLYFGLLMLPKVHITLRMLDVTLLIKLLKLVLMMEVGSGSTQQCTLWQLVEF